MPSKPKTTLNLLIDCSCFEKSVQSKKVPKKSQQLHNSRSLSLPIPYKVKKYLPTCLFLTPLQLRYKFLTIQTRIQFSSFVFWNWMRLVRSSVIQLFQKKEKKNWINIIIIKCVMYTERRAEWKTCYATRLHKNSSIL